MTPTKLLVGQILVVFAIVIAGVWFATQWAAMSLAYQPELGAPWFLLLGRRVYQPWALFRWWFHYEAYAPKVFNEAGAIAAASGLVGCGAAVFGSLWRARQRNNLTTYGSARWASATDNPHSLTAAPSPYLLSAGSVISASLITGLRSDLPGLVTAQVTERVYDTPTGHILLIPQGARLMGSYDSVVAFGQKRALIVWQRIVLPDGSSLRIDNIPATDLSGYSGLQDKVDFHTWTLLKGIALSTLLGVGTDLALSGQSDLVQAIRLSTQDNVSRAGDQITQRSLGIQPTITIRPGAMVRLVVHKDLILAPWREE